MNLKAPLSTAWRFIRQPGFIRHEIDLAMDYYEFKRKYNFLAQDADRASPDKKVLIVSLTDWIAQVKMEGMLAKALQLRGCTPVILTYKTCRRAIRYFQVFGYDQFVFFDETLKSVREDAVRAEMEDLSRQKSSFHSLLEFRFRGIDVGRHVLSSVVRSLRNGSVEFSDPQVRELLATLLPQSIRSALAAESLLDQIQPAEVLFLEKGYSPYGEIFDVVVNRGIDAIQFLHSHRSDALALKRYTKENRYDHPFSLSAESWRWVKEMPWTGEQEHQLHRELRGRYEDGTWFNRKYLQVGRQLKTRQEVQKQLALDPGKKTAVIFSHVLWDATFFYGENLFDDYEQWLVETVKGACQNPCVNWVVKVHPDYVWKMKQLGDEGEPRDTAALSTRIGVLPEHVKILEPGTDLNTFSLFDITNYCVTVRGTIGIEMASRGIPVFTAGTGRYTGLGFTIDSSSREEYLNKLRHIQEFPPMDSESTLLAKKHAYVLFKLRPSPFWTFEMVQAPLKGLGHPLDHNVVVRARSVVDLKRAPDLNSFADWVCGSENIDFLLPEETGA